MTLIQQAMAQTGEMAAKAGAAAPDPMETFLLNLAVIVIIVMLFYVLLIRPQQKRFREHTDMLSGLGKGARVVTQGGLIGTIEKISGDSNEAVVKLADGVSVTILKSAIAYLHEPQKKEGGAESKKN